MASSGIVPSPRFLRILALAAAAVWLAACAQHRGPIVIGAAGPLSQPFGESLQRGMRLAVDQINGRGGVAGGRRLELRFVDDSGSPDVAVRVAQVLYDDRRVVAVVGHVTSGPTIAAARVYGGGSTPVPVISPTASSPELSGITPWFFRVCPTAVSHGPALARFARQTLGARPAGVIYANDDYGRGCWPVIGGDGLTGIEASGALAEGLRISISYLPDRVSARNAAFVRAYAQAYNGQRPDDTGAGAYDVVSLLAHVFEQGAADRRGVRERLAVVGRGGSPFEGVTGAIAFD